MSQTSTKPRIPLIVLTVWIILQLPRFIAWPLIQSVLAGHDPAAWLFPAIIDIVVAVSGLPLAVLLWTRGGLATWVYAVVWLSLSTFDHASAITAISIAGVPSVFKKFGEGGFGVPLFQSAVDISMFGMICSAKIRASFFQTN